MSTKDEILEVALDLFSTYGFESVSTSDIASQLNITKGALYKHYKNKQDIFDSILKKMEQNDAEKTSEHNLEVTYTKEDVISFSIDMLSYWTKDPFASKFRKLLILSQYKDQKYMDLFHQYLCDGPVCYLTELFMDIFKIDETEARKKAIAYYSPMFIYYSLYDGNKDYEQLLIKHLKEFL